MSIGQIIEGTINNILNKEEDLFNKRIQICRRCVLHKTDKLFGEICNPGLYVNPKTNQLSKTPKVGFIGGCSCVLRSKTRVIDAQCPLSKW